MPQPKWTSQQIIDVIIAFHEQNDRFPTLLDWDLAEKPAGLQTRPGRKVIEKQPRPDTRRDRFRWSDYIGMASVIMDDFYDEHISGVSFKQLVVTN